MTSNLLNKPLSTLLLIIIIPWLTMLSVMGLHHGLNFPKKSEIIKIKGTFIYDGTNDDPGWREHDWDGELVSVDEQRRYAVSYQLENYFELHSKSTLDKTFKKPLKAELIVKENSDDQVSFSDGKADLIWGIKTDKIDTNSIEGLHNWHYSSWKYLLRFWVPLITLIIILFLAWEELKQKKSIYVILSILISASPPIINAVWFYFLR